MMLGYEQFGQEFIHKKRLWINLLRFFICRNILFLFLLFLCDIQQILVRQEIALNKKKFILINGNISLDFGNKICYISIVYLIVDSYDPNSYILLRLFYELLAVGDFVV
jgi:hypothetical protein